MGKFSATTQHKFLNLPDLTLHCYNLWDSHYTAALLPRELAELRSRRFDPAQLRWYQEVIQPLQRSVIEKCHRGLGVNRPARSAFAAATRRELQQTDDAIRRDAAKRGFRYTDKFPNSDPQVAAFLFGDPSAGGCGLRSHKQTESGNRPSADQDAKLRCLRKLRKKDEHARQVLLDLCHRTRLQTMLERYVSFEVDTDSRVRPDIKIAATKTWRMAYADPAIQQFPKEVRHYIEAKPGHLLLAADYSQLEARWLAHLSGDKVSLKAFARGEDIHKINALDLLEYTEETWSQLEDYTRDASRFFAKGFLYRISYGGEGATEKSKEFCPCERCEDKVPPTLNLTKPKILAAEERWFRAHHAVRKFHTQLISEVQKRGYYETPFGVRRYFARRWGREFERELKNCPMQTCSALLMNQREVELHRLGAPLVLQHHDSHMLEIPETPGRLVDQWAADLRGIMEAPVEELGGVVFPVDLELGRNWGPASDSNPDGLRKLPGAGEESVG